MITTASFSLDSLGSDALPDGSTKHLGVFLTASQTLLVDGQHLKMTHHELSRHFCFLYFKHLALTVLRQPVTVTSTADQGAVLWSTPESVAGVHTNPNEPHQGVKAPGFDSTRLSKTG